MPPTDEGIDARVRAAAFAYLGEQRLLHGDVIPRDVLARGLSFEGTRVPLEEIAKEKMDEEIRSKTLILIVIDVKLAHKACAN